LRGSPTQLKVADSCSSKPSNVLYFRHLFLKATIHSSLVVCASKPSVGDAINKQAAIIDTLCHIQPENGSLVESVIKLDRQYQIIRSEFGVLKVTGVA